MVKSTKTQRLREKTEADIKDAKQTTLEFLPSKKSEVVKPDVPEKSKQIDITEITPSVREDELVLKVVFKLIPSRAAFSRVMSDLFFDGEKVNSLLLRILQGLLASDCSEFSLVLDMTGIAAGQHIVRVEMYELWDSNEKLTSVSKDVHLDYVPVRKEDRLVRVPIIKCTAGADLAVISESERNIYREMEKAMKKDSASRRDNW